MKYRHLSVAFLIVVLTACGGGSGSAPAVVVPTASPAPTQTPYPASATAVTSPVSSLNARPVVLTVPAAGSQGGGTLTFAFAGVSDSPGSTASVPVPVTLTAGAAPLAPAETSTLAASALAYFTISTTGRLSAGTPAALNPATTPRNLADVAFDVTVPAQYNGSSCFLGFAGGTGLNYADSIVGPAQISGGRCTLHDPNSGGVYLIANAAYSIPNSATKTFALFVLPAGAAAPATPGPLTATPAHVGNPPVGTMFSQTIDVEQQGFGGPYQEDPVTSTCQFNQFQPTSNPHLWEFNGVVSGSGYFCQIFSGAGGWRAYVSN